MLTYRLSVERRLLTRPSDDLKLRSRSLKTRPRKVSPSSELFNLHSSVPVENTLSDSRRSMVSSSLFPETTRTDLPPPSLTKSLFEVARRELLKPRLSYLKLLLSRMSRGRNSNFPFLPRVSLRLLVNPVLPLTESRTRRVLRLISTRLMVMMAKLPSPFEVVRMLSPLPRRLFWPLLKRSETRSMFH